MVYTFKNTTFADNVPFPSNVKCFEVGETYRGKHYDILVTDRTEDTVSFKTVVDGEVYDKVRTEEVRLISTSGGYFEHIGWEYDPYHKATI